MPDSAPLPPDQEDDDEDNPFTPSNASRIYLLPNLMTAGNLFCGFVACIKCIQAHYFMRGTMGIPSDASALFSQAVWFIFAAMAFDMLDGRLARMGGRESLFGAEFDSLADIVSFGLAPALMVFFLILSPTQGYPVFTNIGWFLGFIYLLCAAIRLARFNVITHPLIITPDLKTNKDFVGLPVPAAAGTVAALVLFLLRLAEAERAMHKWALLLPVLMVLIALLMISSIRYPSGKQVDMQTKTKLTSFVAFLSVAAAVIIFKEIAMLLVMLGYIFFGIGRHIRRHRASARARRATV